MHVRGTAGSSVVLKQSSPLPSCTLPLQPPPQMHRGEMEQQSQGAQLQQCSAPLLSHCQRQEISLPFSCPMDIGFMTTSRFAGKASRFLSNFQFLIHSSQKGSFPGCLPGQSWGIFQFKKSIFSIGNLNLLFYFFLLFPPSTDKGSFCQSFPRGRGEGLCSRQQSAANLMHTQNGNTASWWDFCYFVFIKLLISVSFRYCLYFSCVYLKSKQYCLLPWRSGFGFALHLFILLSSLNY